MYTAGWRSTMAPAVSRARCLILPWTHPVRKLLSLSPVVGSSPSPIHSTSLEFLAHFSEVECMGLVQGRRNTCMCPCWSAVVCTVFSSGLTLPRCEVLGWVNVYQVVPDLVTEDESTSLCCRESHSSWSSRLVTQPGEVSVYWLKTNRAARRWTCSRSLISVVWCWSHNDEAYSTDGLFIVQYAVDFTVGLHRPRFLRKKPNDRVAFPIVLYMWHVHCMSWVIVIPRYFPLSTTSSWLPWTVYFVCRGWRLSEILMTVHLWMEAHLPPVLPFFQSCEVFLEGIGISLVPDMPVYQAIVCK